MIREGWYLIVYDIADPKRLKRVHGVMKKEGIAAQKSVFFVRGNINEISHIMNTVAKKMILTEDDLRAYPIKNPENVWTNATNPLASNPIWSSKPMKTSLKFIIRKQIMDCWNRLKEIITH
jgi:CRISPR-associated endonuclease Cas2